jgi:hypothetical protein
MTMTAWPSRLIPSSMMIGALEPATLVAVRAQVGHPGNGQYDRQHHDPLAAQRLSHQLPSDDVADDRDDREHPDDL